MAHNYANLYTPLKSLPIHPKQKCYQKLLKYLFSTLELLIFGPFYSKVICTHEQTIASDAHPFTPLTLAHNNFSLENYFPFQSQNPYVWGSINGNQPDGVVCQPKLAYVDLR